MILTGIKSTSDFDERRVVEYSLVGVKDQESSVIRKHAQFWDKKNKGYITPLDTVAGFTNLGYGLALSLTMSALVNIVLSYATSPSWLPDPRFRINVDKMARTKLRGAYDDDGHFDPEKFEALFAEHAKSDPSGNTITVKELLSMTNDQSAFTQDPIGWSQAVLAWTSTYFFVGNKGVIKKEDLRAVYDGSLFYRLRDVRRPAIESGHETALTTLSGVQIPKNTVQFIEHHASRLISSLPQSVVSEADVRLKQLIKVAEPHLMRASHYLGLETALDGIVHPKRSILDGIAVPTPVLKHARYRESPVEHTEEQETLAIPEDLAMPQVLTGVQVASPKQKGFGLTGIHGVAPPAEEEGQDMGVESSQSMSFTLDGDPSDTRALAGSQQSNEPFTNWLGVGVLTGVKSSPTDVVMQAPPEEKGKQRAEPAVVLEPVVLTGVLPDQDQTQESSTTLTSTTVATVTTVTTVTSPDMPDLSHQSSADAELSQDEDSKSASSVASSVESPHTLKPSVTSPKTDKIQSPKQAFAGKKYAEHNYWAILTDIEKEE